MAKFADKTMDEWDDIVEQWHNDTETELSLREYMGLNEVEFLRYAQNIPDPSLDDDSVRAEAGQTWQTGYGRIDHYGNIEFVVERTYVWFLQTNKIL